MPAVTTAVERPNPRLHLPLSDLLIHRRSHARGVKYPLVLRMARSSGRSSRQTWRDFGKVARFVKHLGAGGVSDPVAQTIQVDTPRRFLAFLPRNG